MSDSESLSPQETPPFICLDQFLKICGVATGGQAKQLIQGGQVLLNGAVETRRRKKLFAGDVVDLDGDEFVVELAEEDGDEADINAEDINEDRA